MPINPGLYFITDSNLTKKDIFTDTESALKAGVKTVQYREKNCSSLEMYTTALKLKELCNNYNAYFVVNDRLDIAMAVKADGIHIGQDDIPLHEAQRITKGEIIIGVSTHSYDQAIAAWKDGADYIGFGPVFGTNTKKGAGAARGLHELELVTRDVEIPVIAIGGIKTDNLKDVIKAGAKHAAIISEVVTATSVYDKAKEISNYFPAL